MRLQSIWRIPLCIMITICFVVSLFPVQPSYAFSNQVIQRGATGDDVIELQARLQYNGFYHGPIDGVYGWSTYWSVRNFQKEFELTEVDGFVGGKTKEMLVKATKYYKDFVYQQIQQGNRFTHYGGMALAKQSAPSQEVIEQAKKAAEKKRVIQRLNRNKELQQQATQEPAGQQQPAKQPAQEPAGQQQPAKQPAQEPAGQQQSAKQPAQEPAGQQQPAKQQAQQQPAQPPPAEQQAEPPAKQPAQEPTKQPDAEEPEKQEEQQASPKETAVNMPNGFSQNDIQLMANAVYGEARGESYIGQVAVAAVILNRVNSPTFPNTVSGVIFEPRAFTAVADGQIWLTPNEKAKKAVLDAINGFDPTENAIYYFNPDTATSGWIWGRPQIKRIGKHIFSK
jgi:N-acetylmuramoyl-L-alanine amidase